jgi:tRNA threonylcarbamoyladenosine biosynthesis protein TsaE
MFIKNFNIQKENKTKIIAEEISKICAKGDVLAISGSMGVGKTTFIKYFIQKISKAKSVPSPSYNIILPYVSSFSNIFHMDAWRLQNHNEALSLGITEMFDEAIFLIEWAEKIKAILPNNYLKLVIKNINNKKFLEIEGDEVWNKRLKNIKKYEEC